MSAKFELEQARGAARVIHKALDVCGVKTVTTEREKKQYKKGIAWKLNFLRWNVWYVWMRMKREELAIDAFEVAIVDQESSNDDDILLMAIQDYLILVFLHKQKTQDVLKVYSQTIKTKIKTYGPTYAKYQKILIDLNLCECEINDQLHAITRNDDSCNSLEDGNNNELCDEFGGLQIMRRSSFL